MATETEQALSEYQIETGLPNIDITPGYGNYMGQLGWLGLGRSIADDVLRGRPDIGIGAPLLPGSPHKGGYRYKTLPNKLEDFLPGWMPGFIRDPLTKLSDILYEDAVKPLQEEYREGDPTWIQDWNPDWKPDWDDTDLLYAPEQRAIPGWMRGGKNWKSEEPGEGFRRLLPDQASTWGDIAKRVLLAPLGTAHAANTSIFRSPRVAVEPTPDTTVSDLLEAARTETGDTAINRLMDLRGPRPIPFTAGPRSEEPARFILDDQPDPYTSITALPLGEPGWRPNLPARTLGGPETDQPRTNLDGTITYLTNTEAMASDVQRALDRAGRIDIPTGPITANDWFARPEIQLQALTELAQTDPTISERYTTPGSQDLIDIATQVDSFTMPKTLPVTETEMALNVRNALQDSIYNRDVQPELQAIAELQKESLRNAAREYRPGDDPSWRFQQYLDPTSQEVMDITTQQESFSAIQEADQQRMEREAVQERADNKRRADEAAARQEQVRADNQRRADEARKAQDRARENRQAQEKQAAKAKAIAEKSKAADDRKSAARAQARADAAAQRERQATIQRQEDQRRKQATERAAAEKKKVDALLKKQMDDMMRNMRRAEQAKVKYRGSTLGMRAGLGGPR